ncbi:fruiting body development fimbrial-like coat protein PRU [Myxococcus xanthus]|uniref:Fruiting body spore coat protein U n=1 Tax=Myxococcus xanthus TaxID=34 RepID=A0A7Y4MUR8_MYXXA|nr:fruiting body spore coat protein U [Myxococcus xanthus]NOJ82979.1 fruiting body spore coat protein U [Myxococcus xanthus]NOJ90301.1 fruiting body spore coat protein U [Myxococcus xanthus]
MNAIKTAVAAVTAAASLVAFSPAEAATATANLNVTANVGGSCAIGSGGGGGTLNFGTYDPIVVNSALGVDLFGTGALSVQCTLLSTAVITLGQGLHPAAGSTDAAPLRQMRNTASPDYLAYSLYQDVTRLIVWGNTAGTGLPFLGTGLPVPVLVYGTVPRGQNVPSGTYNDTVVATITF